MPKPTSKKNLIYLPDGVAEDADFGDEVEVSAVGKMVDHDGQRCLQVKEVDGEPVRYSKDMKDKKYSSNDDESEDDSEDSMEDDASMTLDDALDATFNRSR